MNCDQPDIFVEVLAALGPETEAHIDLVIEEFSAVPLIEEERLSALASAIAVIAATRHLAHRNLFIEALRGLALELSVALGTVRDLSHGLFENGPVDDARDILIGGLDGIVARIAEAERSPRRRVVTELVLIARLLGRYSANKVHLALAAAAHALDDPLWHRGDRVAVTLYDAVRPLARTTPLEIVAPRGTA